MWDVSSPTRDQTHTPCIGRRSLNHWAAREVPQGPALNHRYSSMFQAQRSQTPFGIQMTAKLSPYHDLLAEIFLGEVSGTQLLE